MGRAEMRRVRYHPAGDTQRGPTQACGSAAPIPQSESVKRNHPDGAEDLTCQFTVHTKRLLFHSISEDSPDNTGPGVQCDRLDWELVPMPDEGVVRLCPQHRSWASAMGDGVISPPESFEVADDDDD